MLLRYTQKVTKWFIKYYSLQKWLNYGFIIWQVKLRVEFKKQIDKSASESEQRQKLNE